MPRSASFAVGALALLLMHLPASGELAHARTARLDPSLAAMLRTTAPAAPVRVIVETTSVPAVVALVHELGGRTGRTLADGRAVVAALAAARLSALAQREEVVAIRLDRPLRGTLDSASAAIGADWVTRNLGFDGTGIGVAIIDSGVTAAHDDLSNNQIVHFADFVDLQPKPHDGYGHGTHVAGIIAGSGHDSGGERRGIAPGAHLVVLRALDARGEGYISDAIAAIDYAIDRRAAFNIRVINLSVAARVTESYRTDPLTLAARRAVDAGIVVVTAAGNLGKAASGRGDGGITAPGNAPWVLTVGASSHNRTADRADDTIAPFSSHGPSAIDLVAKPDLVAPGVGIESLADPGSTLFVTKPSARRWGIAATAVEPYMSLSGTSMAAPLVTGTVALMLEANPELEPDAVKAILRASAVAGDGFEPAAQGAGFLDARGALLLAQSFAGSSAADVRLRQLVRIYGAPVPPDTAGVPPAFGFGDGAAGRLEAAISGTGVSR